MRSVWGVRKREYTHALPSFDRTKQSIFRSILSNLRAHLPQTPLLYHPTPSPTASTPQAQRYTNYKQSNPTSPHLTFAPYENDEETPGATPAAAPPPPRDLDTNQRLVRARRSPSTRRGGEPYPLQKGVGIDVGAAGVSPLSPRPASAPAASPAARLVPAKIIITIGRPSLAQPAQRHGGRAGARSSRRRGAAG